MLKFLKKEFKRYGSKLGYTVITNENYSRLKQCADFQFNSTSKNDLLKNVFELMKLQDFYPEAVYDVGANKGTWTLECLKYFPKAKYYLFEPQKELLKDIEFSLGHFDNIQVFPVGVGKKDETRRFTVHDRDDSCSFSFSTEEAKSRGFEQIELPIVRLESFIKEKKLSEPSLLKIDAEGLDLEVLEGADTLLEDVQVIMIEVGVMNKRIKNSALETINYLNKQDFRLFDITDINRPFPNHVLWLCEFVFIKKNGVLDKDYSDY